MKGIVIGAGRSWTLHENEMGQHLRRITNFGNTLVFATDRTLKSCLKYVKPEYIVTGTTESYYNTSNERDPKLDKIFKDFYDVPVEQARKVLVHLSCQVDKDLYDYVADKGFRIGMDFHRLTIPCHREIPDYCPSFREGYNIGMCMICIAAKFHDIKHIATVGIDFEPYDQDMEGQQYHPWQGEYENSLVAMADLVPLKIHIYNCNINNIGRFDVPLSRSTLEDFEKI